MTKTELRLNLASQQEQAQAIAIRRQQIAQERRALDGELMELAERERRLQAEYQGTITELMKPEAPSNGDGHEATPRTLD